MRTVAIGVHYPWSALQASIRRQATRRPENLETASATRNRRPRVGAAGLQCFRDTATDYRAYTDEYLDLLVSLAQPGTIIRVARTATWGPDGFYPDLRVDDPAALTDFIGLMIAMMEEVRSSADAREIPSIDVGAAFNGPEYTELAPDDYLVADRLHLADTGSQVVAQLLADLGFEPTIPTG